MIQWKIRFPIDQLLTLFYTVNSVMFCSAVDRRSEIRRKVDSKLLDFPISRAGTGKTNCLVSS